MMFDQGRQSKGRAIVLNDFTFCSLHDASDNLPRQSFVELSGQLN